MRLLLRILLVCTIPFLCLSGMVGLVLLFASLFVVPLTVENQTGQTLLVTPVGTLHEGVQGPPVRKVPLPLMLLPRLALPAPRASGFRLEPHASRTFHYDRDDLNCSELVLEDERGRLRQYVTWSKGAPGQSPVERQDHYTLTDFDSLPEPGPDVLAAAGAARGRGAGLLVTVLSLLVVPWVVLGLLWSQRARLRTSAPPSPPGK